MDDSECRITITHRVNLDTNCVDIVNLIQCLVLCNHLLVNGKQMLDTSVHFCLNARFFHILLDLFYHLYDKIFTRIQTRCDLFLQVLIHIRIEILHRKIIEFDLNFGNTKTVCKRCINIHRLTRFLDLFCRRLILHRPQVVQTIGKFNQYNPDILRHRKEHLTQVLCLHLNLVL